MFQGFPANLGYHVKSLENYAKTVVKCWSNRGTQVINHGDTIRFSLPKNSLIDLKSISLFYKGTAVAVGVNTQHQSRYFPRLSSSIIESLSVYSNGGQLIQTIDQYNTLYNILYDWTGGNKDAKQLENADPSVKYTIDINGGITVVKTTGDNGNNVSDTNRQFCINSWLGFLGTSTTDFIDTKNMELEIEIRLAPAHILFNSAPPAAGDVAAPATASYTISDCYLTMDRINFHDPLFYQVISQQLESGLRVGFDTYSFHTTNLATDKAVNMSFSVNARNLSMLICSGIITDRSDVAPADNYLELVDGGHTDDRTFDEVVNDIGAGATNLGVAFNNSKYFRRTGNGILTSQIEVNSIATSPWPLSVEEIYNQNLINFNQSNDVISYIHKGCMSLQHFQRDYFFHSVSFSHRGGGADLQCGLDGKSSSIDVKWTTTSTAGCGNMYPIVYAVKKEVLVIYPGHQLVLEK